MTAFLAPKQIAPFVVGRLVDRADHRLTRLVGVPTTRRETPSCGVLELEPVRFKLWEEDVGVFSAAPELREKIGVIDFRVPGQDAEVSDVYFLNNGGRMLRKGTV